MARQKAKLYASSRWQQLRRLAFAKSPYCMYCYKREPNQIDHLGGCPDDNDLDNLIPSCQSCHSCKTTRIDLTCRLVMVQNIDDALIFVARKCHHDFHVPEHVLTSITNDQRAIYDLLRLNSMSRPAGLVCPGNVYDLRYVLAVIEINRKVDSSNRGFYG